MKRNLFSFWFILAFLFAASVQSQAQSIEKADKLYELGKYPDAIKAYQKILEKQPEYVEALSHLADSYRRVNQLDEAKQAYSKASTLPNFEPEHLLNYGKVLMSRLEYIKAKDIFKRYAQFNRTEGEHFIESCDFALTGLSSPSVYKVAESNINSAFADYGATLVGNNVIFTSARPAKSNKRSGFFGSTKFDNQVFEAAIDGKGGFAAPILYHTTYKSNFNEGPVSFSGDGKWVAFTRNNFSDGTRQVLDLSAQLSIYIAPIAPNGDWGEAVAYTYNGNGYSTGFPCLNQDGTMLYFASDRPGGSGGYDLYQSKRDAGTERWGAPQNLDNIVNSPGNEITPYYDGKNLFFASDWHQGFGGLDVFRAELDKSNGWSKVFHLGNGVNSPNDDYGFSYDSKRNMGFFTSNRVGSRGREDIFLVSKQSESIVLQVTDELTRLPIAGAKIDLTTCGAEEVTTDADGRYTLNIVGTFNCTAKIKKEGYTTLTKKITTTGGKGQTLDFPLLKSGTVYEGKINDVAGYPVADVVVKATHQDNTLVVEGMTDATGVYSLGLLPKSTYIIRYSKAGYNEISAPISTGSETKEKVMLGLLTLKESMINIGKKPGVVTSGSSSGSNSNTSSGSSTNSNSSSNSGSSTSGGEISYPGSQTGVPQINPTKGFAVQITTMSKASFSNINSFANLSDIGTVYPVKVGDVVKIRVGLYGSRIDALDAQKALVDRGFKDCFIVPDTRDATNGIPSQGPKKPVIVNNENKKPIPTPQPAGTTTEEPVFDFFKVRLATYRDPSGFNSSKLDDLGSIEQVKSGEFTVMLLGNYGTADDAKAIRGLVAERGFADAQVVQVKAGKIIKVN